MPEYLVPGVFVEELAQLPPAVAEVDSALPAFVGYTAQAKRSKTGDLRRVAQRIRSLAEFEAFYGQAAPGIVHRVDIDQHGVFQSGSMATAYYLYDALRLFYANGGGDCYIVSVGSFSASGRVSGSALLGGMQVLAGVGEVSLLLCPDAAALSAAARGSLQQAVLAQCAGRRDRFAVVDPGRDDRLGVGFRQEIGSANLGYGAAYAPWLLIHPAPCVGYAQLRGKLFRQGEPVSLAELTSDPAAQALLDQLETLSALPRRAAVVAEMARLESALAECCPPYRDLQAGIATLTVPCPPSGAVVGIYARVDRERGVWKAPANVVVNGIAGLAAAYSRVELESLMNAGNGKSINPIRQMPGQGWLVWGARTLASHDSEWLYVPVRRLCSQLEASIRQSTGRFVFEPSDAGTWLRVRRMIEDYLLQKWQAGALQGARPEQAFFVRCGLGQTMTAQDIGAGRMIVEFGLAAVRPAEFIVLRCAFEMQAG